MCEGSPQRFVHDPIVKYLTDRGVKINLNSKVSRPVPSDRDSGRDGISVRRYVE
jgi:hypothetical protein